MEKYRQIFGDDYINDQKFQKQKEDFHKSYDIKYKEYTENAQIRNENRWLQIPVPEANREGIVV